MVKKHWMWLLATFIVSAVSLSIFIVSFTTTKWVVAEAETSANVATQNSEIHYGLFTGEMAQYTFFTPVYYDLTIECLYSKNKCVYSCQQDRDERVNELERIIAGQTLKFCPIGKNSRAFDVKTRLDGNSTDLFAKQTTNDNSDGLLNSGLWLTTVIFLSIGTFFAFLSAVFSLLNIAFHSVEPILSVFGLYIWNGIAIGGATMTLIMWGSFYAANISDNIGITYTAEKNANYSSADLADLGYSYWILFVPIGLHIINIALLIWRRNVMNSEPPPPVITVRKDNTTILLY